MRKQTAPFRSNRLRLHGYLVAHYSKPAIMVVKFNFYAVGFGQICEKPDALPRPDRGAGAVLETSSASPADGLPPQLSTGQRAIRLV
jgi:hypothetical protein